MFHLISLFPLSFHKFEQVMQKQICFHMENAILMDLAQAFDILNHELLLVKLHIYCLENNSLDLIFLGDGRELK